METLIAIKEAFSRAETSEIIGDFLGLACIVFVALALLCAPYAVSL